MAAKKSTKKYLVVGSACGDVSQAHAFCGSFSSIDEAKKAQKTISIEIENDTGDTPRVLWICEIVETGESNSFIWK